MEKSLNQTFDFEQELEKHVKIHAPLFKAVDFSISHTDTSNEDYRNPLGNHFPMNFWKNCMPMEDISFCVRLILKILCPVI